MNFFNHEENSQLIGYKVILEQLTVKEWKQLISKNLISIDTKVCQEGSDTRWTSAGKIPKLSNYFRKINILDSLNSFSDAIKSIFNELDEFCQTLVGEKLIIPNQLYETLEDYLNEDTDDVALTIGKVNGQPVFIVLLISKGQPPIIKEEIPIDIDTSQWSNQSIRNWPETGSRKAKVWNIKRYN
ncbi:hypothetical protein [Nostoc sp. FACHB-110]|uniref:hypothetical protein n=1 Tax=Nostoc sp. FACHB-110 TaxID=2692834 RepID=UPI001688CCD8|nr:hypothetical protein [Nostoc sp. FACHB-110]MBD2437092.1 hypothetical protein [Nostoc sp. FACHB-110]